MTAPSPAGLSPLLDQLDEARAKGTPGPWAATSPRADGGAYIDPPRPRRTSDGVCWVGHTEAHADAEAIVAAVNALPQLTAAVRAVLALADELERKVAPRSFHPAGTHSDGASQAYGDAADRIRSALTAALTPGADTAGATA